MVYELLGEPDISLAGWFISPVVTLWTQLLQLRPRQTRCSPLLIAGTIGVHLPACESPRGSFLRGRSSARSRRRRIRMIEIRGWTKHTHEPPNRNHRPRAGRGKGAARERQCGRMARCNE